MFTIRTMTMDDYDAALELWRRAAGVDTGLSDRRDAIARYLERNPDMSFVAYDGDTLVGAVLCGHEGRRGYLHHLAVDDSRRGEGIGRALVDACLDVLKTQGVRKCNAFMFADNHEGRSFWEHVGWRVRDDVFLIQRTLDVPTGEGDT